MRDHAKEYFKINIKDNIKDALALYEIARPWNMDRHKLVETIAEMTVRDILDLVKEYERKRTKGTSKGLRDQGAPVAGVEQ